MTAALLLAACNPSPSGGGGGITVPQNDASAPDLTLGVSQGNQTATVKSGGGAAAMTLTAKTGSVNMLATAVDNESGVQNLQIWVERTITTCDAGGTCSGGNPGLLGSPAFGSSGPTTSPGQTTAASSIMAQAFDLTTAIPQTAVSSGTRTVKLDFWAVAVNHLGGKSQTTRVSATWKEP
jgi:hypothetical protein